MATANPTHFPLSSQPHSALSSMAKAKIKDLTKQRFGLLVVSSFAYVYKRNAFWFCQCDCGNTKTVQSDALQSGNTKSCGCFRREAPQKRQRKDLVGQRFGRLVVQRMLYTIRKKTRAECQCDCGNLYIVAISQLITGKCSSCGCGQRQGMQERKRQDLTGQRFGRLVVQRTIFRHRQRTIAECLCDCGNTWKGNAGLLIAGTHGTRSCGCLKKELDDSKRRSEQHKREVARLVRQRRMARERNLPCTFTSTDLAFMLQYWDFSCAVCGRPEGFWHLLAMDHWIPVSHATCPGLTPCNTVPLCHTRRGAGKYALGVACNTEKHDTDPLLWLTTKLGPRRATAKLREIETYFAFAKERSAACLVS